MRQIQFEVRNANELRRELARVKRISKNESYKHMAFQIFTQLSDLDEIKELTDIIEQDVPWALYYGCQTFGNIYQGRVSTKKTVVLCTVFEYETTKSKFIVVDPTDTEAEYKTLNDVWQFCNENSWVKAVEIISSAHAAKLLGIGTPLYNLREDVQVFGGISINPDDIMVEDTYVFAKPLDFSKDAAIMILLGGDDFHIQSSFARGWEGLGKSFTITDCDGTLIKKIDNESPMEIYRKYLNIDSVDSLKLKSIQFPMLVEVDGVECIRQPFRDENDECISVMVGVENGMKLRLSYGDKQTIIDASKKAVPEMAEFAPDVIHIYSCASRRRYLGDEMSSMEASFFEDIATTVGFFTRGEILRVGDYLHFFNSTMVYVMAREGEKVSDEYFIDENALKSNNNEGMIPNLINYIGVVTNEIEGQFLKTMSGMANIYKTMFIIDTDNAELIQLDGDDWANDLLAEKEDYKDKFNNFIENVVNEEYVDLAKLFVNIDNLSTKMKLKNTISCDLLGKNVGWFRAQFVVINRDKDGNADRFVFTTQVIDDEKKELEEQHRIVEKLADTYHTIHLFDLETDGCKEIDTVELLHVLYKKHVANGGQCILHEAMKASVRPEHLDMMLEFTDFSTLDERLNGRKFLAIDFHGAINGWAKAQFIEYERTRDGKLAKVLFVTQIIEEEKRKEEELIKKSTIDELTGLLNRRAYEETIRDLKSNENLSYVICSLDVNGLKVVNDDIGHSAGDELLRGAAEVLLRCLGAYGKVFRIGGDEFNAIIVASDERIKLLADDLDNSMLAWTGKEVDSLSISYGFASRNEFPDKTVEELEEIADQRMYESKEAYYRHGGQDRRSQKQVYDMICKSYIKILSVNLSEDNYRIIKTNESEMKKDKGYSDESISKWLTLFAQSGQVHPEDKDRFIEKTNLDYLRRYFEKHDDDFTLLYRRKSEDGYENVLMEITKTDNFKDDNMEVFLYIKKIGE